MNSVIVIEALSDNYIYLYRYGQKDALVIDPGDARVVFKALEKYNINLSHILLTHHHYDHTAGGQELIRKTGCKIVSYEKNEMLKMGEVNIQVIPTPGHTMDSVCYYVEPFKQRSGILFTGDTLFIGGCGRDMECDSSTMWNSLKKLKALPDDTLVYPGHNYTEENYEFALTIEPHNETVKKVLKSLREAQKQGKAIVPSTMGLEKETNIFLQSDESRMMALLNMSNATESEVFAELRSRKNIFG